MKVAIVGGGISGLALAYYLQKLGVPYDLFEADNCTGGTIRTLHKQDYLLEAGPNVLQLTHELEELLQELKLQHEVVQPLAANTAQYVFREDKLNKLPLLPLSLITNNFFSWKTKQRILQERQIPAANIPNETISQFFKRRFGSEAAAYAVAPLVRNLYAGDPDKLLVASSMPRVKELEMKYGSVLTGLVRLNGKLQKPLFSFRSGMQVLPEAITDKLISVHTGHQVEIVTRAQGKYIICCSSNGDHDTEEYDALVLALPAHKAAEMLQYTFPGLAAALQNISYPPLSVVHTVYNRKDIGYELNGFGAYHLPSEATYTTGSIWTSSLFEGRCRPHEALITTFVGGNGCTTTTDTELLKLVDQELQEKYKMESCKPVYQHVHHWPQAIPQYDLFIQDAHYLAKQMEPEGLFVAANWQAGLSVHNCIRHAKELAYKINLKLPLV